MISFTNISQRTRNPPYFWISILDFFQTPFGVFKCCVRPYILINLSTKWTHRPLLNAAYLRWHRTKRLRFDELYGRPPEVRQAVRPQQRELLSRLRRPVATCLRLHRPYPRRISASTVQGESEALRYPTKR